MITRAGGHPPWETKKWLRGRGGGRVARCRWPKAIHLRPGLNEIPGGVRRGGVSRREKGKLDWKERKRKKT